MISYLFHQLKLFNHWDPTSSSCWNSETNEISSERTGLIAAMNVQYRDRSSTRTRRTAHFSVSWRLRTCRSTSARDWSTLGSRSLLEENSLEQPQPVAYTEELFVMPFIYAFCNFFRWFTKGIKLRVVFWLERYFLSVKSKKMYHCTISPCIYWNTNLF